MSYQLGDPKTPDDMFFGSRKAHAPERVDDDTFPGDMGVHKDLFDTISEAHYLPELSGPHDEALLESLVEKGCEDNQILGQALDKLAHLVHGSGEYPGQDDLLLSNAPVSDIIDRLESLGSPGGNSMTAAQGLLHLHHIGDHPPDQAYIEDRPPDQGYIEEHPSDQAYIEDHPPDQAYIDDHPPEQAYIEDHPPDQAYIGDHPPDQTYIEDHPPEQAYTGDHQPEQAYTGDHPPNEAYIGSHPTDQAYMPDEVFAPEPPPECPLDALTAAPQMKEDSVSHIEYEPDIDKSLQDAGASNVMYTDSVPDLQESFEVEKSFESSIESHKEPSLPDRSEIALPPVHEQEPAPENTEMNEMQVDKVEPLGPLEPLVEPEIDQELEESEDTKPKIEPEENYSPPDPSKDLDDATGGVELVATDLSIHSAPPRKNRTRALTTICLDDTQDRLSDKSDEQPKDLSFHKRLPTPHASPRRLDIPRAPSRESDAMQSPQPSGIPAIPSSPEIFTMPLTKSKQTLFLETLLSSPSPKMYTSEVTITKQNCEPLNLGKNRKSASPTVSSCSDEIKKVNKEFGEPQEKKLKSLAKNNKDLNKCNEEEPECRREENREKRLELSVPKSSENISPVKQIQILRCPELNIPDPLLIPKNKLNDILANPGIEIQALLVQRPELRLPEAFAFPAILQDPDILVISLAQLENIIENDVNNTPLSPKSKEIIQLINKRPTKSTPSERPEQPSMQQPDQTNQTKPTPSMDALAGDIDAATSAALNQMIWLPYLSQLEAMATCSQNMDFLKALNSSGYTGPNYPDVSQMLNPQQRLMGPAGFPIMPPVDYDNRLQFAMWQEAMNQANASQRSKSNAIEAQIKEIPSKTSDVQNPFVHSTKNHQSKTHTSARTSPIAPGYNSNQRLMQHNQFLQNMYPGMNPNLRPNVPLPGLQIPYFNPNMMSQRSPRTGQQKSPTSPYYPNNNYLQSVKHAEAQGHQRSSSASSQGSPRPRISVKSLHNLLEPAATSSGMNPVRRSSNTPTAALGRRREEPEVGSTTPGEPPVHMPPHPHDPASFHLWHPLFGNHKSYNSPWSWTTVTATGD